MKKLRIENLESITDSVIDMLQYGSWKIYIVGGFEDRYYIQLIDEKMEWLERKITIEIMRDFEWGGMVKVRCIYERGVYSKSNHQFIVEKEMLNRRIGFIEETILQILKNNN